eukprot:7336941-Prymnesium_polylepis.1
MMHLTYFLETAGSVAISHSQRRRLFEMVRASSDGAWFNASVTGHQDHDACDSTLPQQSARDHQQSGTEQQQGASSSTSIKRFHWKWDFSFNNNSNGSHPVPPPDTAAWFTKDGIRCVSLCSIAQLVPAAPWPPAQALILATPLPVFAPADWTVGYWHDAIGGQLPQSLRS